MAEMEKKPRDIKDLKARLGRTVTPGQAGKPASVPPAGGSFPPPAGLGSRPPSGFPSRPPSSTSGRPPSAAGLPKPASGSGIAAPFPQPIKGKGAASAPGGIAAPPFMQPKQEQKPAVKSADPFAQAAPGAAVAEKKVTLVIDDSAVSASDIGKKSAMKVIIVLLVGVVVGVALGFMVGNTAGDRKMWDMVISDTKRLYDTVNEVSKTVEQAKMQVQTLYSASQGGPGQQARVDYGAIERLVALKRPITANAFHRKRYMAFQAGTVDDLFDYYNNINLLWNNFAVLGAMSAGAKKRELLDKSAKAADALLNYEYGLIPFAQGGGVAGGIVYVERPQGGESNEDDESANKLLVSSRVGGNQIEKTMWVGQNGITTDPSDYVILINKSRSMGTLGQVANQFGEFRGEVTKMNLLMNKTMETQGRLIKTMGEVAAKY
jgi:F0F1-type ATP synthase assembly protein I